MEVLTIAVDKGHCLRGCDTSADGKNYGGFNESHYDRVLGDLVINMLRAAGHKVIDVTVDDGTKYADMYGSLADRVKAANTNKVDLYIAIHFNASANLEAVGTETWIAPRSYYGSDSSYNTNYAYAKRVNDNIASLGFANRGVKQEEFYVLANSNAHAILIETCFCTGSNDKKLYDSLGHERVAEAIVAGILNRAMTPAHEPRNGYVNVKPFMGSFPIFKDEKNFADWNTLVRLGCPISLEILENPSKYVYKVKDCRYGYVGYIYAEDTANFIFSNKQEYKETKIEGQYLNINPRSLAWDTFKYPEQIKPENVAYKLNVQDGLSVKILEHRPPYVYYCQLPNDRRAYIYCSSDKDAYISKEAKYNTDEKIKGRDDFRWKAIAGDGQVFADCVTSDELLERLNQQVDNGYWKIEMYRTDL